MIHLTFLFFVVAISDKLAESFSSRSTGFPIQNDGPLFMAILDEPSVDFAAQELKAQLQSMRRAKATSRMISSSKTRELESYLSILRRTPSPIALQSLCDNNAEKLIGSWWLGFTSENSSLDALPRDANISLKIYPNYTCDYCIDFGVKSLQSLTAKSTFSIDSSGLFKFIYKDVVADLFGIKNIPVLFFGLLSGRENFIETVWFDGNLWVERSYSPNGVAFNLYIRETN